ncbi:MAG TPA: ATP-binding protein [Terracidiphilus sp.]|jgi:signal transduction histidine kinase|nr:ATP-binding protein [Terracidiphilus sp.]
MRLKTKLVIAIASLVLLISGLVSLVYVTQLLDAAVKQTYETNKMVANQVRFALQQALETGLKDQTVDPNNPAQLRNLEAQAIHDSAILKSMIDSVNLYSLTVYDINIGDAQSRILLSTNPETVDKPLPVRSDYKELLNADAIQLYRLVFGPPRVFDVVVPLDRNGEPFATVHVGARTTLLREAYSPWLRETLTLTGFALGSALLAALLLSNLALRPMEEISMQLDYWTAASEASDEAEATQKRDTAERVSTKIEQIGQRMRNVEEVFSALKENLDQILGNLQDGILLFTGGGRAVLVSEAARRFLHVESGPILGLHAQEIFDRSTVLGRTLRTAFANGATLEKEEIRTETGHRIQASLDFIYDDETHKDIGALVTLHDLESVEAIESELELSRRMAAIGRLTSGVGHEVKNPINAIVVHLELLKNKLGESNSPAARHLEVIDAEIHRLDRVVQTLVDFSRPVELQLKEQDLRQPIGDVLALALDELSTRNVTLESTLASNPLIANVDADLLKQAVINVIQNGAQAMPDGGRLRVVLEEDKKNAVLRIADEGTGISEEIRDKIFDLYFTTKSEGSGIGLAMTYRILQLHHGSVEVQSNVSRGTEFVLRIPLAATEWGRRHLQPANMGNSEGNAG